MNWAHTTLDIFPGTMVTAEVAELCILAFLWHCYTHFFAKTSVESTNDPQLKHRMKNDLHNRKRLYRSKSPEAAKQASPPPNFFSIVLDSSSLRCISEAQGRCSGTGKVKKSDRKLAAPLRPKMMAQDPTKPECMEMLQAFARCCLCTGCQHEYSSYGHTVADIWQKELVSIYEQLPCDHVQLSSILRQIHRTPNTSPMPGTLPDPGDDVCTHITGSDRVCVAIHVRTGVDDNPISLSAELPIELSRLTSRRQQYELLFDSLSHKVAVELKNKLDPETGFSIITPDKKATLASAVCRPLGPLDRAPGYVYIYKTEAAKGHVKIGYSKDPANRFKAWYECCKLPTIKVHSNATPNAQRVETLIHTELQRQGLRRNKICKKRQRPGQDAKLDGAGDQSDHPPVQHDEWFAISEEEAIRTVEYWVAWMARHKPYDEEIFVLDWEKIRLYGLDQNTLEQDQEALDFLSDSHGNFWESVLRRESLTLGKVMGRITSGHSKVDGDASVSCTEHTSTNLTPPRPRLELYLQSAPAVPSSRTLDRLSASGVECTPSRPPRTSGDTKRLRRKSSPSITASRRPSKKGVRQRLSLNQAKLTQYLTVGEGHLSSDGEQSMSESAPVKRRAGNAGSADTESHTSSPKHGSRSKSNSGTETENGDFNDYAIIRETLRQTSHDPDANQPSLQHRPGCSAFARLTSEDKINAVEEYGWSCPACTYYNGISSFRCDICPFRRPNDESANYNERPETGPFGIRSVR